MLRRKILTSAMASVMALTSISVVAFADETETAVKNVKTKADLEAYVKSFDSFRDKEINDYGSIAGERFLAALEYAQTVLDDGKATVDDYTVSYKIIDECYAKLRVYTSAELRELINRTKGVFDSDNIMNDELQDLIYDPDKFSEFAGAYIDAETYLNSNDSRILTDCYEALTETYNDMIGSPNTVVSKSQFRTVLKNYESMLSKLSSYDEWRRGQFTGEWVNLSSGNYWMVDKDVVYEFGAVIDLVQNSGKLGSNSYLATKPAVVPGTEKIDNMDAMYAAFESKCDWGLAGWFKPENYDVICTKENKGGKAVGSAGSRADFDGSGDTWYLKPKSELIELSSGSTTAANAFKTAADNFADGMGVKAEVGGTLVSTVEEAIKEGYEKFVNVQTSSKTTDDEIVDAYNSAADALLLFDAWKADNTTRASKANVERLLKDYNHNLQVAYRTTAVKEAYVVVNGGTVDSVDMDNLINKGARGTFKIDDKDVTIAKNGSITAQMRTVVADDVQTYLDYQTTPSGLDIAVKDALQLYEDYKGSKKDSILVWDGTGAVATADKESVAGWTLVYRKVKYALEDKFPAAAATYTKKDVADLIELSYELVEKTGDAYVFADDNSDLVAIRQNAVKWLREANKDKGYKDGDPVFADGFNDYLNSTQVYNTLKSKYDALDNLYKKYAYGYSEIYNKISEVLDMLDSGALTATDELNAALSDTTYALFILNEDEDAVKTVGNEAFNAAGEYLGYNRLYTPDDGSNTAREKAAKEAYEKLLAEVDKQINPDAKAGDVNKDGAVNSIDAALILKAVVDGTVETLDAKVADFNTDGAINALDAAAILKAVVDGTV